MESAISVNQSWNLALVKQSANHAELHTCGIYVGNRTEPTSGIINDGIVESREWNLAESRRSESGWNLTIMESLESLDSGIYESDNLMKVL